MARLAACDHTVAGLRFQVIQPSLFCNTVCTYNIYSTLQIYIDIFYNPDNWKSMIFPVDVCDDAQIWEQEEMTFLGTN